MKREIRNLSQKITYWSGVVAIGLLVGLSLQFVRAWTEPSAVAPGGNVAGPVNVSDVFQSKAGSLEVRGLGIIGGVIPTGAALVIPNGNVAIGIPIPNNTKTGIIDVKDAWVRDANGGAGAWASAASAGIGYTRVLAQPVLFRRGIAQKTSPYYDPTAPVTADRNVWTGINLNTYGPPANAKFAVVKFYAATLSSWHAWVFWRLGGEVVAPISPVVDSNSPNNSDDAASDTNTVWVPYSAANPVMQVMWKTDNAAGIPSAIRVVLEGWVTQ
jgi:hypothetical protein